MISVTAIGSGFLQVGQFLRTTARTRHEATRTAKATHELSAILVIREEYDGFLGRGRCAHNVPVYS